ncbi:hypothetical protein MID13_05810 [Vibrio gigantis]|uniref:hypothetical protein n=1 Tax=Vibrio gigantis TaxID=296199 RepID=UPI001EFC196C|nr:hypothetical protein [Vibrio gigantis]MCZ8501285.1 hypothetical protein [Vibrio lentus]ULN65320.1 hypothetical protein MID13_05810 [Vibrio gigantis]
MHTETFTASVQYNDQTGTAAADHSDDDSLISWLRDNGHAEDSEFLIGVEMFVSDMAIENDDDPVWVSAFLKDENDGSIRKVRANMSFEGFFSSFKRFNIMLSRGGELTDEDVLIDSETEVD